MRDEDRGAFRAASRDFGRGTAGFLTGLVLAALPPAWRGRGPDEAIVRPAAAPSAILQVMLGFALYAIGFFLWMQGLLDSVVEAAEAAQAATKADVALEQKVGGLVMLTMNPLLPLIYFFTSWLGFLSGLVLLGGAVRAIHLAVSGDNMADPTLATVDWARQKIRGRAATAARERAKGPTTPDQLTYGDGTTSPALSLVTRDDLPWHEGSDVYFEAGPHRLIARREFRDANGRLRLRFDFRRLSGAEAARGHTVYQPTQPPLVRERPGSADAS